jgi:DinB superfamily
MDLASWLVAEHDDTAARWRDQVLAVVPADARITRLPDGNSMRWTMYHVARHAALALDVVRGTAGEPDPRLEAFPAAARAGGAGLQEVEQPWAADLDPDAVVAHLAAVLGDVRGGLAGMTPADLDRRPDVRAGLARAGVSEREFGWLHAQWDGPVAFLVRWPLLGHVTHHVGELITIRNLLGHSPFR